MTSTAAPADQSPHWDQIAFFLHHALSLFGDPAALAQKLWLSARDYKLFSAYISPLEDLVRRLIFIAALEHAPMTLPPTPERKFLARAALPANTGAMFDPDKPETWRVSFKLQAPSDRRLPAGIGASAQTSACLSRAQRASKAAQNQIPSAPCAQRLEALIRAYENRDKLAANLARKIARNARVALAYIFPRKPRRGKGPAYITLDFSEIATQAHQNWIHRKLAAVAPDSS